jgi:cereblon
MLECFVNCFAYIITFVVELWRQIIAKPSMDDHVRKPDILSFHIGSKLPVSESVRQKLLEIDGISYRLQKEIQLLKAFNLIKCRNCQVTIYC